MSVKISQLPTASLPLIGNETFAGNQNGTTITSVLSDIKTFTNSGVVLTTNYPSLSTNWQNTYTTFSAASSNYALKNVDNHFSTGQTIVGGLTASGFTIPNPTYPITFKRGMNSEVSFAIGFTLLQNLSGNFVVALGYSAGDLNSGDYVTAISRLAAYSNTGSNVNALGWASAYTNTGSNINALGTNACYLNTGNDVNALGHSSAAGNAGNSVVAIGTGAATNNAGNNVVAIGNDAGVSNFGDEMIAIGTNAGTSNEGSNNIFIGRDTLLFTTPLSSCIIIGREALATANNQFVLGSTHYPVLTASSGINTNKFLMIQLNGQTLKIPLYS